MVNFREVDSIPFIPAKGFHIPDSSSIQQWSRVNDPFFFFRLLYGFCAQRFFFRISVQGMLWRVSVFFF